MNTYEELAIRVKNAMRWLDDPERTQDEIDKWFPNFKTMFDAITLMEREMRRNENT